MFPLGAVRLQNAADLYVAASAAIPVLWIGVGLSTGAIGAVARALRSNVLVSAQVPFPLTVSISVAPVTITINGLQLGTAGVAIFFGLIVVSGLLGEITALYVLFAQVANAFEHWAVFVSGSILTGLTAIVLAISIGAAANAREGEERPPGFLPQERGRPPGFLPQEKP